MGVRVQRKNSREGCEVESSEPTFTEQLIKLAEDNERILLRQTIDDCVCNRLMSTDPGKRSSTKLSFQENHASTCETMKAAFVLDSMPVIAAFQRALSNDTVALYPELWLA
ncbi:hypothetical protein TNCV_4917901 [Trichonephila clavipes]|nr:hypothetical protein TNCV_4917901 [Trichonephila clavipes]